MALTIYTYKLYNEWFAINWQCKKYIINISNLGAVGV
jgi:hypothetical protein